VMESGGASAITALATNTPALSMHPSAIEPKAVTPLRSVPAVQDAHVLIDRHQNAALAANTPTLSTRPLAFERNPGRKRTRTFD
jgi:hypothetical protein